MSDVVVESVTASGSTLTAEVSCSASLRRFFTGRSFRATYDVPIEDVPPSILSIPVLANVCPVAWTRNADVSVDEVDRAFLDTLGEVRDTLVGMYPSFMAGGEVRAGEVVDADPLAVERQRRPAEQQAAVDTDRAATVPGRVGSATSEADRAAVDERTVGANGEDTSGSQGSATREEAPTRHGVSTHQGASTDAGRSGLLFTGGVDSLSSYVRHRDERPVLVTVGGWTVHPDDEAAWNQLRESVTAFGERQGLENRFVRSNALSVVDHPMLLAHFKRYVDGGWYSSVGHGLGLLGLCAPLAWKRGIDDLYMAATHWRGIDLEWGSHPDIDDHVRWSGTRCHHDGYELTRQERLDTIADYVRAHDPDLQLQTCNDRFDGNCGRCEKCYRTAVGLRIAGLEPVDHGYPFTDEGYERIAEHLEAGDWVLGQDERCMWEDIQHHAHRVEPRSALEAAFFAWLQDAEIARLVDRSGSPLSHRLLWLVARNTPYALYSSIYPVYESVKGRFGRDRASRT